MRIEQTRGELTFITELLLLSLLLLAPNWEGRPVPE